jgi:DNA helicase-2/ATP-dependent DNA helicase PcrA
LNKIKEESEPMFLAKYEQEWTWRKKDLSSIIDLAFSYDSMANFIESMSLDFSLDKKQNQTSDKFSSSLVISTVHSAKGLEWDHVYIPCFIEGHMPSSFANEEKEIEEEKRLFYVATTRAKNNLEFSKPLLEWSNSGEALVNDSVYEYYIADYVEVIRKMKPNYSGGSYNLSSNHRIQVR